MRIVTSAGCLIKSGDKYLLCHATGQPQDKGWGLPKGKVDKDETLFQAAIRETKEECGIDLNEKSNYSISLGPSLSYKTTDNKEKVTKKLFVFIVEDKDGSLFKQKLECETFFELRGKKVPEVDNFLWVNREKALTICMKSIRSLFNE